MSNPQSSASAARMGTAPVNSLLLKTSIPMMISMLVQALYNVVDSIFVSYVGESALSAVSLAFPIQNLMIAFAVGTAIGVNAHLSKSLGEKNQPEADLAASNGLFLAACSFVLFLIFGLVGAAPFMRVQTTDPAILHYGIDYLSICTIFSFGCFAQCMLEKLLVATGRTTLAMTSQLIGAVTNIILDPIFIFGLCGVPRMEAAGAAVATVLGQCVGAATALVMNLRLNHDIHLVLRDFKPCPRTIRRIYAVGAPSIAMNAIGSVMVLAMNTILMSFTSTAVAVFGVYFKLQSFVFMPIFGLNNGMVPIISYNFGARKPARIIKVFKLAVGYALFIMLLGFLAAQLMPDKLLSIFQASSDMLALGDRALRIISFHFLLAGFSVICSSVFQALGRGMLALWVSIGRQLVVLIPAAWLLSLSGDVNMVWWCFPIAEVVSVALCAIFLRDTYKKIIQPMEPARESVHVV
jgi:putative MATE family efflux protein